jgi:uncharacterized radical SAM superfamily Fe-S cluster-containing enzyme
VSSTKRDADHIFHELTRSICPECRRVIDAQILLRDGSVYMRKRCPEHGQFEGLVYADADAYVRNARLNKPGTIPLEFTPLSSRKESDRGATVPSGRNLPVAVMG